MQSFVALNRDFVTGRLILAHWPLKVAWIPAVYCICFCSHTEVNYGLGLILQEFVFPGIPTGWSTRCSTSCRSGGVRHWYGLKLPKTGFLAHKHISFSVTNVLPGLRYVPKYLAWHKGKQGWKWGIWPNFLFCFLLFVSMTLLMIPGLC